MLLLKNKYFFNVSSLDVKHKIFKVNENYFGLHEMLRVH